MATYAIGDVQGCLASLDRLLEEIRFDSRRDRLWLVGDLVNRGPDSLGVLRRLKALGDAAVTVLGNHDLRLLTVAEGWAEPRPKDTFRDVLGAQDRAELIRWLRERPLAHREGPFLLIHAGLLPQWSVAEAMDYAGAVESLLRSERRATLLRGLYGPRDPQWAEATGELDRLRVAANVLTRLRICDPEGRVDWPFTGPPEAVPDGYHPWYEVPRRRSRDATILFGHWSALGFRRMQGVAALDSGCVWRRRLTALRLDDQAAFHVSCAG